MIGLITASLGQHPGSDSKPLLSKLLDFFIYHERAYLFAWLLLGLALWAIAYSLQRRLQKDTKVSVGLPLTIVVVLAVIHAIHQFLTQLTDTGVNSIEPWVWLHASTGLGGLILLGIGILDDWRSISGRIKLGAILAAWLLKFIVVAGWTPYRPVTVTESIFLCIMVILAIFGSIGLPVWDGLDGLFPMLVAFICLNIGQGVMEGVLHNGNDVLNYPTAYYGQAFAGIVGIFLVAFLPWNFPKARAILSEKAVLPVAFLACAWALDVAVREHDSSRPGRMEPELSWFAEPYLAFWILTPVVVDLCLVVFQRIRHGRSPFSAGHDHLHHRLLQLGYSPAFITLILTLPFIPSAIAFMVLRSNISYLMPVAAARMLVLPLFFLWLFIYAYTQVDPYKSGAVDERGRP